MQIINQEVFVINILGKVQFFNNLFIKLIS